jgi:protein-S-isoprenylcysteine O-methyltransferase Ste14
MGLPPSDLREVAGALLSAASMALFAASVREFGKSGTPIPSSRPSTTVVRTGPFQFSRNPIYVAFTGFQLGVGLWAGNGWILVMLIPTLALISQGVIAREEKYMTEKFGEDYRDYCRSVRRWL